MIGVGCEQQSAVGIALHKLGQVRLQVDDIKTKKLRNVVSELDRFREVVACINEVNRDGFVDPAQHVQKHQTVWLEGRSGEKLAVFGLIPFDFTLNFLEIHCILSVK